MKNVIGISATLAALSATLVLPMSPASADGVEDCAQGVMTASELASVDAGMRWGRVIRLVGGTGIRVKDRSSAGYMVRQWDYCTDGSYYANQWLVFEPTPEGPWVLTEIR